MSDGPDPDQKSLPVADRVLVQFVDALVERKTLGDVAERLKTTLIGNKPVTENALRRAIFGEDDA